MRAQSPTPHSTPRLCSHPLPFQNKSTTSSVAAAASEADNDTNVDLPRPNYSVGDIVGEVALERLSRSIQFPCRPLMNGFRIGGVEETAHTLKEDFLVNPDGDPVHYGWRR